MSAIAAELFKKTQRLPLRRRTIKQATTTRSIEPIPVNPLQSQPQHLSTRSPLECCALGYLLIKSPTHSNTVDFSYLTKAPISMRRPPLTQNHLPIALRSIHLHFFVQSTNTVPFSNICIWHDPFANGSYLPNARNTPILNVSRQLEKPVMYIRMLFQHSNLISNQQAVRPPKTVTSCRERLVLTLE